MPRAHFVHVETWVFDLDNTLYPAELRLFDQIERRMTDYVMRALGVDEAEAHRLRRLYWEQHGTTLAGLMQEHRIDPEPYLAEVHDIDLASVLPSVALRDALGRLPGRKIVFTNGSREHARRVTAAIGLDGAFDRLYGFEDAAYVPKPQPAAFATIFGLDGLAPDRAAMFEDDHRNLAVPHCPRDADGAGRAAGRASPRPPRDRRSRRLPGAGGPMRVDVLVAGGGVAGLTAAAAFAAAGFETMCVDPVPPVTSATAEGSDLRSTAFLLPAVALLERAGLWGALERQAAPLRVMRIVDAGGAAGRDPGQHRLHRRRGRGGRLRLQPAQLAATPRDGGAPRRAPRRGPARAGGGRADHAAHLGGDRRARGRHAGTRARW